MKKIKKCLVIDGNNISYRAYYASKKLEWMGNDKEVYVFLKMLISTVKRGKYEKIFVAFDEGKENFRKKILENYKGKREEVSKEIIETIEKIKKVLKIMKIEQESAEGFEADDLIASFIDKFEGKKDFNFHILSQDKDLYQLISDKTKILRYKNKSLEKFGKEEFLLEKGFPSDRFGYYLSLKGDEIDNIKGVKGIGDKRACKIVSIFETVEETFSNLKLLTPDIVSIIKNQEEKIRENSKIVSLIKNIPLRNWEDYNFSWTDLTKNEKFITFCKERKMKSILNWF